MIVRLTRSCALLPEGNLPSRRLLAGSLILLLDEVRISSTYFQIAVTEAGVGMVLPGSLNFIAIS